MDFPLTPETIDKIAFAMEDQGDRSAIDVRTGELVHLRELADPLPEGYAHLPRWGPAEGFNLMQSFVSTLRNPVHRQALSGALGAGKGVFRAFKDALKANPEIERLWFRYKERRLRSVILGWYNTDRVARGLEKLAPEPEETDELVAADFSLAWGDRGHAAEILDLDRQAFLELFPREDPEALEQRYRQKRGGVPTPGSPGSPVLVAESPTRTLVGFAWGLVSGPSVHLVQLVVVKELRGIGLGETILRRFLADLRTQGARTLTTELSGRSLRFSGFFRSLGFQPTVELLSCSLDELPF